MGKLSTAVDHHVVAVDERRRRLGDEARAVGLDVDLGVERRRFSAALSALGRPMSAVVQDLALQVGELDHVVVDDAEAADAGGGEVVEDRRAEPAGADHQHGAVAQGVLPPLPDLREDEWQS